MNARGSILSNWIIQIVLWLCDLGENLSVLERERERESFHMTNGIINLFGFLISRVLIFIILIR